MTTTHYDALETRDPAEREAALMAALPGPGARAGVPAPWPSLAGVDAASSCARRAGAAAGLRKGELLERQKARRAQDPFGGYSAIGWAGLQRPQRRAQRVYQSPGPIYEPEGTAATTGAWRAPCTPPASAPATWCTTASATT
jgi:phenylacetate-CoA ligase